MGNALVEWQPSELKNQERKLWLRCRDDPAKGLKNESRASKKVCERLVCL